MCKASHNLHFEKIIKTSICAKQEERRRSTNSLVATNEKGRSNNQTISDVNLKDYRIKEIVEHQPDECHFHVQKH